MVGKDFKRDKDKVVGSIHAFIIATYYHKGFFVGNKFYSSEFLEHWSVAKLKSMIEQNQIFYAIKKV